MLRSVAVALSVLLMAGCTNTQSAYVGSDYSTSPATRMNVGAVVIDSTYTSSGMEPNIEQNLIPQPQDALRTAITQHYLASRPNGSGARTLRFTIKNASVVENQTTVVPADAVTRVFAKGPTFNYAGHLEVESKTEGASLHNGYVHAEATRTLDVSNAKPEERAKLVQGMVSQMVDDIIQQLDKEINANMGGYVISGADMTIDAERSGRWDHVMEDRVARSAGMRVITTK